MASLARFEIAREPDVALSVRGATRGFNLLTVSQDSQHLTGSPAALLLTPTQALAIKPLTATSPSRAAKAPGVYDGLHDELTGALHAGDFDRIELLATAFLKQYPIMPLAQRPPVEQAIRRFIIFKGRTSATAERLALYNGLDEADRARWMGAAHARIDLEKAQVLATAVSGVAPPRDVDLLGGLRADLAFSVLAACVASIGPKGDPRELPIKYFNEILTLNAFLPSLAFAMEPCRMRDPAQADAALSRRLSRLRAYEARVKAIAAQAAAPEAVKGSAAGTAGHADDCDCACDDAPCMPIDPCCADIGWYVAELLTLKDRTHCYKPSDIAYIENVAPYETRVRSHGFTRTVTETSEDETNFSRLEERDHQVTDRFNLQKEIANNQRASLDVDARLSGKSYGQRYELNTSASLSRDSAYREAREEAREVVEKAALKIQVQTRKLRTRSVTMENTEQNRHKFRNDTAAAAVTKYFWVTQEKRAQLFGHGPSVSVDLLVPSPALLFTTMERLKRKKGEPAGRPAAPVRPALVPTDIKVDNYLELASRYEISGYTAPPEAPPVITIGISVSKNDGSKDVTVPPGYTATSMSITSKELSKLFFGEASITLSFGGGSVSYSKSLSGSAGGSPSTSLSNSLSGAATIGGQNYMGNSYIAVAIVLTPDPVDLGPWRNSIHALIMEKYEAARTKYEADLAAYQAALAAYNERMDDRIRGRHPFACEEIVRAEVKRSSVFMMCGEFDWPGVMNMNAAPCGLPWPNRSKAAAATREWYFFDRAFDWNRASFTFYDYFRNPICQWIDGYEPDEPNFLMKAFLRAGYCRATVPVSPGMEEDVRTYLQTGGLWGVTGTFPSNPDDPRWISVIDEIKHSHDCRQQDREGHAEAYPDPADGTFDSRVRIFTDRYWDAMLNVRNDDAINLDLDRQIFIDGIEYRIVSITEDPASPPFTPATTSTMSWIFGLERRLEFAPYVDPAASTPILRSFNYAIGAKYVGAPFHFELPTDLIWIGDQGNACLPCYPVDCVGAPAPGKDPDEE